MGSTLLVGEADVADSDALEGGFVPDDPHVDDLADVLAAKAATAIFGADFGKGGAYAAVGKYLDIVVWLCRDLTGKQLASQYLQVKRAVGNKPVVVMVFASHYRGKPTVAANVARSLSAASGTSTPSVILYQPGL